MTLPLFLQNIFYNGGDNMAKQKYLNAFTGEYMILDDEEVKKVQEELDTISFDDYFKKGQHSTREIHLLKEICEIKRLRECYGELRNKTNSMIRDSEHQEEYRHAIIEMAYYRQALLTAIDHILI
jgi:hypothetical protein